MNFVVMGPVSHDPRLLPLPPRELAEVLGNVVSDGAAQLVAVGTKVCRMLSALQMRPAHMLETLFPSKGDIILTLQVNQSDDGSDMVVWEAYECSPDNTPVIH